MVKGPSEGGALEELMQMVRELQIAQAWRDNREQQWDRKPLADQRCMWCDVVGHVQKECADFAKALRSNMVYLWNGRVHASESRKTLELNTGHHGMKRLMEEVATRHTEAIHYSTLAGIQGGSDNDNKKVKDSRFWPSVLKGLSGV